VLVPLTVLETFFGIALALAIAFVRGSLTDRAVMVACTVGMSISILVYIIVFQYGLAYKLGLFPVQGWGDNFAGKPAALRHAADPDRPAVSMAPTLRLYRSFVLDEANQDYVRTARAKGLSERRIDVGARAAQCRDSHHHPRHGQPAGAADRRLPAGALLRHSRASGAR
jgi:peptide/nickel transport system permease protein